MAKVTPKGEVFHLAFFIGNLILLPIGVTF